ncbi:MAG: hypothetical protein HY810_04120 [Candidatus Omnitrophica bacterium]|nr:hypothetical protein [Candidatus Omnitrophota bacterium]
MKSKPDKRKKYYKSLKKTTELAELIGIILGDGHIQKFPRTERIVITCGFVKKEYIKRIVNIVTKIFEKAPSVLRRKTENVIDVSLYRCGISGLLEIPSGNKIKNNVGVPAWIKKKCEFAISCLKGLFETDGCIQYAPSNYAQYIELKNLCEQIKVDTYYMLKHLGYTPQLGKSYVRLARKKEVESFRKLIKFRA